MAEIGKKWYVLKAVSGKEAKVKEYIEAELKHNDFLASHVSQVLIPMEKHASVRQGKRVVKEKVSLWWGMSHILYDSVLMCLVFLEDWIILPLYPKMTSTECWARQRRLN